ncbi:hypothetical protein ABTX15_32875 [Micromonospora sp. NPDC094482]|uniref:hypothetical protein n=1 Tax=unclassified Micromonospora TaxID=2617518 RepID=UPI0033266E0C
MKSITARIRFLLAQTAELDPELLALVKATPRARSCSPSPASVRSSPPSCW